MTYLTFAGLSRCAVVRKPYMAVYNAVPFHHTQCPAGGVRVVLDWSPGNNLQAAGADAAVLINV